jgi:hypothetical protein
MLYRGESNFDKATKFLLNLALLVLLFVGLWKVVASEFTDVLRSLRGDDEIEADETRRDGTERRTAPADVSGGR